MQASPIIIAVKVSQAMRKACKGRYKSDQATDFVTQIQTGSGHSPELKVVVAGSPIKVLVISYRIDNPSEFFVYTSTKSHVSLTLQG